MKSLRSQLAMLACAAFSSLSTVGLGQEISYEVLPGSYLEDIRRNPESESDITTIGLSGTFDAILVVGPTWLSLDIRNLDLASVAKPEYRVMGTGGFYIDTWRGKLPGFVSAGLQVDISSSGDYLGSFFFTNECRWDCITIGGEDFPRIGFGVYQSDFETRDEYFRLTIAATPTRSDASSFFRRGDFDGDGKTDISDAVSILNALFLGGAPSECSDAADTNDDGRLDVGDPIVLLGTLFLGEDRVAVPRWICGIDPTEDTLSCAGQVSCMGGP